MLTGPLGDLVRDLAADEQLVDEVVEAARADFPEVARLPWAESRRHVADLLAAAFTAFARYYGGGTHDTDHGVFGAEPDFSAAFRFGAERAALGVPVAGLLSGVHAGRSRLLKIAITRGRDAGIPLDMLLQGLLRLDRFGTALERTVIDGYRSAERELNRDDRSIRMRVLRRLLLDDDTPTDPAEDPARFGLRTGERYHCVVSDAEEPGLVRTMEQTFGRCGGLLAPVEGRLTGLVPRLPADRTVDPPVLVVTTPPVVLADARAAYRLCRTALVAARARNETGMRAVSGMAGETALAAQPMLAAFLSDDLLAALDQADDFHRQLASTALAYLDHGQRLDLTATALHVHPNTVRYRLRRLQELCGFAATAEHLPVLETVRWWWALHTWSRPRPHDLSRR